MFQINITKVLVGSQLILDETYIEGFDEVVENLSTSGCEFELEYDDVTYTGVVARSTDSKRVLVSFEQKYVTLPAGVCLMVNCPAEVDDPCPNVHVQLTPDTKLSVLGDDGCPIGYIKYSDILEDISSLIPTNLCQLYGVDNIEERNLIAQDRILVTSGQCDLSSVPQSDIACQ